jgi:hypothetical protein
MRSAAGQVGLPAVGVEGEAELGGDDDLVADGLESFTDQFLVDERSVHLGRVEEGDTAVDGRPDQGDVGVAIGAGAVALAHAHGPEAEGGDPRGPS